MDQFLCASLLTPTIATVDRSDTESKNKVLSRRYVRYIKRTFAQP